MHELSMMMGIIKIVGEFAEENRVEVIDTLVLQIGELSDVIPRYIEEIYPIATARTILEGSCLKMEKLPGNALCKECGSTFNLLASNLVCPFCSAENWEIQSGKEFFIKEIVCRQKDTDEIQAN
jgi:hydrogenase nickel incorporation protein HypA/HybF